MKNSNKIPHVAYFCMEYGLHEEFHLYSGGLGILAGDHMKASHDLNLPLVGVGLLWRQGYTRQMIGEDGQPYDSYPIYDYDFLKDTGVTVKVKIRNEEVAAKVWKVDKYKNAPLYLLDTFIPENKHMWITGQLYGGVGEVRIAQEMILGIGGVRALRKLGIDVDVYHFNEGHAALAGIELIHEKMEKDFTFKEAWAKTREEIVFTTHTPILAGNESHSLEALMYMGANNGLTIEQMVQLGDAPFGMTIAGLRLSRIANGVAQLHGKTSKNMWKDVKGSSTIIAITNGVHRNTWVDPRIQANLDNDETLWNAHMEIKKECIEFIKERTNIQLDADKLLIGFARRAAPYKRSDLIFKDLDIIEPYLKDGKIQIVFSGKAHPLDIAGKGIVANLVKMMKKYPNSVVFLENYDISIGRMLTRGTDVWLNNPRRPLEASGTSGMKAAMNGILNLSTLDGWWPEACEHGVNGWQLGDCYEGPNADEHDLKSLYKVLLEEVVPTYYKNRDKWIQMMRASVNSTYEKFSAARMLNEYYNLMYSKK
ncbi:MAG: alpha-glucan family phosphorylase [Halanaerobiales bacterium]|nr:alpha-glucan family phosphorylase [Halanaerobiales bacterium]